MQPQQETRPVAFAPLKMLSLLQAGAMEKTDDIIYSQKQQWRLQMRRRLLGI